MRREMIVWSGVVDDAAAEELAEGCRALADRGARLVVLDLSAVRRCEPGGLVGLGELVAGWSGVPVRVSGVGWAQLLPALAGARGEGFDELYRLAHGLAGSHPGRAPLSHRRAAPASRTGNRLSQSLLGALAELLRQAGEVVAGAAARVAPARPEPSVVCREGVSG